MVVKISFCFLLSEENLKVKKGRKCGFKSIEKKLFWFSNSAVYNQERVRYANLPYFLIWLPRQLFIFEMVKPWKIHIVSALAFLLCNENLNIFLTRVGKPFKGGKYSREETIWGNTVDRYLSPYSLQILKIDMLTHVSQKTLTLWNKPKNNREYKISMINS